MTAGDPDALARRWTPYALAVAGRRAEARGMKYLADEAKSVGLVALAEAIDSRAKCTVAFPTWVSLIVSRKVATFLARERGRARVESEYAAGRPAAWDGGAARVEAADYVHAALPRLTPPTAAVVWSIAAEGASHREAARKAGLPLSNAQGRYELGMDRLRTYADTERQRY